MRYSSMLYLEYSFDDQSDGPSQMAKLPFVKLTEIARPVYQTAHELFKIVRRNSNNILLGCYL